ncbi:uncharacterized protein B0J16DRAFT_367510 [Fusarium flagelliforme]|uniref:Feruloyl esterase b n=1 Tax=Fusarium flagelliforme TaxID=2675880 RepID=A0A395N4X5_9HYPO|nr:uncharacterized protein B0J16DRAFT_367510 [Fusarium flagelliforme]KAH7198429.1 hypothetical protein B0J16DRAFT_367510 [Fusarium flagelliforme]RFN55171.1 feruloyl esterase b [Fusarium flagelliforme]
MNRGYRGHFPSDRPGTEGSKAPPLGDIVERISRDDLSGKDVRAEIQNVKFVASYNWVSSSSPKIIIPGQPPKWTPLKGSKRLPGDSGDYYRDMNAAFYPKHPMEPAIVSVMKMHPEPMPVSIFGCGSSIGNLLRFARGVDLDNCFRILVEKIGNTVHFIRRENAPDETIKGIHGFGHTFPEAYTTWDPSVKRSKSHQRILSYQFGGFDLLVRFEGDGYLPEASEKSSVRSFKGDDLDQIQDLGVSEPPPNTTGQLVVSEGGEVIPQTSIFDLKTRSARTRHKDHLGEQLPRLWISQMTNFLLAYHERGLFQEKDIEIKNIKSDVEEWQDLNQPSLNRLAALFHRILDSARASKDGKLEIVWSGYGSLEIRQQLPDAGEALSASVKKQWEAWLGAGVNEADAGDSERWEDFMATLSDSDEQSDYAACDVECGYCGKCT